MPKLKLCIGIGLAVVAGLGIWFGLIAAAAKVVKMVWLG